MVVRSFVVELLAGVPLFADLTKRELSALAARCHETEFMPGDYLMHAGEPGRRAYVIVDGTASVWQAASKVATVGAGDVVGEISLVTDRPRNASVRADTIVSTLQLGAEQFLAVLEENPSVSIKVLRTVGDRLAAATG